MVSQIIQCFKVWAVITIYRVIWCWATATTTTTQSAPPRGSSNNNHYPINLSNTDIILFTDSHIFSAIHWIRRDTWLYTPASASWTLLNSGKETAPWFLKEYLAGSQHYKIIKIIKFKAFKNFKVFRVARHKAALVLSSPQPRILIQSYLSNMIAIT